MNQTKGAYAESIGIGPELNKSQYQPDNPNCPERSQSTIASLIANRDIVHIECRDTSGSRRANSDEGAIDLKIASQGYIK